jgi:hypothetical protein
MPPKLKIKNSSNEGGVGEVTTAAVAAVAAAVAVPENSSQSLFLSSLSPLEQRVCAIAESHLESSFDISRSSGYIAWKAKNAGAT